MRDHIQFLLGHEKVTLREIAPTRTIMRYLREDLAFCGTKEGCAEGDCGACTVIIGRLAGDHIRYEPINSCIRFVATLDGCQLLTVEHLSQDGRLHAIQEAMVEAHGSQCGFCTPGIVMSLYALWLNWGLNGGMNGGAADQQEIEDALAGNLCRCTGYGPIIEAAGRIRSMEPFRSDPETVEALREITDEQDYTVGSNGKRFLAPASIKSLCSIAQEHPDGTVLAGSTDVGLWVTKQHRKPDPVIWTGRVKEMHRLSVGQDEIEIGGAVSYADAVPVICRDYPGAAEMFRRLGSKQIRAAGTVGGNIANGSPIGDSPPMLIAAGTEIELRKGDHVRRIDLEGFYIDYGRQDRQPGEVLTRIFVKRPNPGQFFRVYKISKRFDQDISAICAAIAIERDRDRISSARIAFGGMAAIPKRAWACEAALLGKTWSEDTVRAAMSELAKDFTPISDMRASAAYRLQAARNLLMKAFVESHEPYVLCGPRRLEHV